MTTAEVYSNLQLLDRLHIPIIIALYREDTGRYLLDCAVFFGVCSLKEAEEEEPVV